MASSGGGVPAERATAAVNHLVAARDGAAKLRAFLLQQDVHDHHQHAPSSSSPWAQQLIDGVLNSVLSAMSLLDDGGGAVVVAGRSPGGAGSSDGASRPQQSVSSCGNRRKQQGSTSSRRSHLPSDKRITSTLDDGHVWRKYGQKEILNSPHPRSYYRCTHKSDQGCKAKRHVQRCETDPSKHVVTYIGEHTCRDPSTIPLIVPAAVAAPDDRANYLISFGPSGTSNNAATASTVASSSQYLAMGGSAADHQRSASWCTSDDVFSSSAGSFMQMDELIGAVVGSAGVTSATVGSAPDHGRIGGGGTASFPPSPNSLSFVVGSLGSIAGGDDDDMFGPDP